MFNNLRIIITFSFKLLNIHFVTIVLDHSFVRF